MFWRSRVEAKMERMASAIQRSFANVKTDTGNIQQWIQYLYKKNQEQEAMIRKLNEELSRAPKTPQEIKRIIDSFYSYEGLLSNIQRLNSRVDELLQKQQAFQHSPLSHQQEVRTQKEEKADTSLIGAIDERLKRLEVKKLSLKERLIKRLTKNSKDYVKSVILTYIKKYESIPALQLKEMVVDDQALCSKSSFYRILEEVEGIDEVGIIRKGKENHYFIKAVKKIN